MPNFKTILDRLTESSAAQQVEDHLYAGKSLGDSIRRVEAILKRKLSTLELRDVHDRHDRMKNDA